MTESNLPQTDKKLVTTTTGEIFQPIRLHYELMDRKELLRIFNKLGCIDFDPKRQRWVWMYVREARSLKFERSYDDLPKEMREIVLGSFYIQKSADYIRSESELLLDLRSFERAVAAIEFFDKHIPRIVAKLAYFDVVNRLFSFEEDVLGDFDLLFKSEEVRKINPFATLEEIESLDKNAPDFEARRWAFLAETERKMNEPRPEVDRLPVGYYEDGIEAFSAALKIRQTHSLMEWAEGKKLSFHDYFARLRGNKKNESSR